MASAITMTDGDNVATAVRRIAPGESITVGSRTVTVDDEIPFGHKVALERIGAGSDVVKYGLRIGSAMGTIGAGEHVHVQNVESNYGRGDRE